MWSATLNKLIASVVREGAAMDLAGLRLAPGLACIGALLLSMPTIAAAEDSASPPAEAGLRQPGKADELFARGKERLAADDYGAACPLLAESYALDPATGSLLALALCHERQGKLASALREYNEVVERSRSERREDREQAARARVYAIQGRVSTLVLHSAQKPEGMSIRVNDLTVRPDQLGSALPTDGGFVLVEVEAEGKQPWRKHVTLADGGDVLTVMIPQLEPQKASTPAQVAPLRPVLAPAPRAKLAKPQNRFSATEIAGITLLSAGGAGALVAVGYTAAAVSKNKDSRANCDSDLCTPKGREVRQQARQAGDIATIAVIAATTLSATGLIALLVGRSRNRDRRLSASGWIAPGGGGAAFAGRF